MKVWDSWQKLPSCPSPEKTSAQGRASAFLLLPHSVPSQFPIRCYWKILASIIDRGRRRERERPGTSPKSLSCLSLSLLAFFPRDLFLKAFLFFCFILLSLPFISTVLHFLLLWNRNIEWLNIVFQLTWCN